MKLLQRAAYQTPKEVTPSTRDYGFDNIRALLIAFVVFGHFLESFAPSPIIKALYQTIYSFHMPLFIFLLGHFSKPNPQKLIYSWIVPYITFQTLYILFERIVGLETELQYSSPYWHLWFLLACSYYLLLLPIFDTDSASKKLLTIICITFLALAVGFDNTLSHSMALGRFFTFQPWFVLGFYYRGYQRSHKAVPCPKHKLLYNFLVITAVCFFTVLINLMNIPDQAFYGAYPYSISGSNVQERALIMLAGFSWIVLFVHIVKPFLQKRIPALTSLGQNTLPVFLLHAIVIKALPKFLPQISSSLLLVLAATVITLAVFGNPLIGKCFHFLFSNQIYDFLVQKIVPQHKSTSRQH